MSTITYNKEKIDELFARSYVANTSLIKDLDLDDYEDKAIIINQENSKQYQLDKSATATADLGKWKELGDEAYILKATNTVTLDGVVYPTLRGDVNFAYRCYENFKAGKTVFVTYDEKNIYEVINAEFDESGNVPSAYVEYICGNWLIKTGTNSEASTFEEHYNLVETNALESVDALPTSDIKTSIFYRLKADTTDNKKGIYYAVKNADNTYTWTMADDNTYIFKTTKTIGIEGISYPSLEGDVNYAYRCYENFKAGKTVLLTYDEKNYYMVNTVKYYEDGGLAPNVLVQYLATYWLVTTGATSSLHTYATYKKFMTDEALTSVTALPTSDIHTNIFYRLSADTAEHSAGIYYAVKNADNTYTWKAVGGGGGGGGAVLFTMTQSKEVWGVTVYYPTVEQFEEILEALKEGKDVWVTTTSANHYTSRVIAYRTGVLPYADYFAYEYSTYRIEVNRDVGASTINVIPWQLLTQITDNLVSTDTNKALSARQGNTLYQTKLGFVNDLTATTIADLWTWANGEETKDFLKLHQRTVKFSTTSECPKGTSTSDVFVATIYTNTANYGYIRAINYNTGIEYNNYNNNGTWTGWWNSTFEANKHQTMTRANMWNLGDGVYTNVTWNSSDYPVGVTSTGTTTTVIVTGNPTHNYGTITCYEQGAGRISTCSVQNGTVKAWREVVSYYGTGTFNAPSGVTINSQRMMWYDVGNTRIVHLTAEMKGISISAHSGKSQTGFKLTFDDGKKFFVNNTSTGCVGTDISSGITITVNGRSSSTANNDFSMNFFNAYTSSFSTSKVMSFGLTFFCTTT